MAELLATGLAAAMSGTAAGSTLAGGLASAATATAAGAAATTSSALQILQGVATAFTALSAIGGGFAAMQASNEQADATELQAGQEQLAGEQRRLSMRRELARVLGENDVAFAAAGIDVAAGGGIAAESRASAREDAAADINIDRDQDEYRRALLKVRARGLRRRGTEQMLGGFASAIGAGLDFGIDVAERGI